MIKKISVLLLTLFVFQNSLVLAKNCEDKNMEKKVKTAGRDKLRIFDTNIHKYKDQII